MDAAPYRINSVIEGKCQGIEYRVKCYDDKCDHKQGIAGHKNDIRH